MFSPGEFYGQRSLTAPWSPEHRKELDTAEWLSLWRFLLSYCIPYDPNVGSGRQHPIILWVLVHLPENVVNWTQYCSGFSLFPVLYTCLDREGGDFGSQVCDMLFSLIARVKDGHGSRGESRKQSFLGSLAYPIQRASLSFSSISTANWGHSGNAWDNCTKRKLLFVVYPRIRTLAAQEFYTGIIVSEILKESSYTSEGQLEIPNTEDVCVPKTH